MADNAQTPIRILIADDHAVVRKGLVMVLRLEPGFEVVGEAGSGAEAVVFAKKLQPDIVLLDRVMPGSVARETVQAIKEAAADTQIVMLTGTELDSEVLDLLGAGVDGYVLKEIEPQELKLALRKVAAGEAYLQPTVTRHVIDNLEHRRRSPAQDILTPREFEVLEQMATSATYREIAAQLSISEETVRSHAKHILSKLNQPNRDAAVAEGLRLGILHT
jgi:DNA-binding NarL/FixJ family response regulator